MHDHEEDYDPNCDGCRPALLDLSGKRVPDDHPIMVAILEIWDAASLEEKRAYMRVTMSPPGTQDPADLAIVQPLIARMSASGTSN